MMFIYFLIILIVVCLSLNNYLLTSIAVVISLFFILSKKDNQNFDNNEIIIEKKEDLIDNTDVIMNALYPKKYIPNKSSFMDLDEKISKDNVSRGKKSQTAINGAVRSTADSFAKFFVDQANIDENVDWVNENTQLDNDSKFQPLYQK